MGSFRLGADAPTIRPEWRAWIEGLTMSGAVKSTLRDPPWTEENNELG